MKKQIVRWLMVCFGILLIAVGTIYYMNYTLAHEYQGEDVFIVKDNDKYFYVDSNNEPINKEKYDYIAHQQDGYFRFCRDKKWGYLDALLTESIAPEYSACGGFADDKAPVLNGEVWTYINKFNQTAVEGDYKWAGEYVNKMAVVKKQEGFLIIDEQGNILKGPFYACDRLYEGAFLVQETDKSSKMILDRELKEIKMLNQEEPIFLKDEMLGIYYLDNAEKKGKLINIKSRETLIDHLDGLTISYDNTVFIKKEEIWILLDENLKVIGNYENVIANSHNLFPVLKDGKWGAVNKAGKVQIEPKYEEMGPFSGGYASVKSAEGKWGVIDKRGKKVIPCKYEFAQYALEK